MSTNELELTPEAWMRQGKQVRGVIFEQLDQLAADDLAPEARDAMRADVRARLKQLKKERDQMIGYLAEEATFIDEIETRFKEIERVNKRGFRIFPPAPANAQIDYAEKKMRHFAQGMSFYKLFWVFFIGSFLGVVVERTWCFVRYGLYEPRVGAIYGPFNPVYGLGAVALTAALYPFRNRSKIFSFLGGALVGSTVEYFCSWFQETVFGSASWDYSSQPLNLNGRICLLYSVYWAVLGVLWIKEFYPRGAKLVLKIPNKAGRPLTIALAVLMALDIGLTGLTLLRWMERYHDEPPRGAVEEFLDRHYPDERMEKTFSNLVFYEPSE